MRWWKELTTFAACVVWYCGCTTLCCNGQAPFPDADKGELAGHLNPCTGWGFINRQGKIVFPLKYREVHYVLRKDETILFGVVDDSRPENRGKGHKNEILVDYASFALDGAPKQALKRTSVTPIALELLKKGSTNPELFIKGNINSELPRFHIRHFTDGFAVVDEPIGNRQGVINESGDWVIPPRLDSLDIAGEETFCFSSDNGKTWGLINKRGNTVIKPRFVNHPHFVHGTALGSLGEKNGDRFEFINAAGETKSFQGLRSSSFLESSLFEVYDSTSKEWGAIDLSGKLVIPCYYDELTVKSDQVLIASKQNEQFLINRANERISPAFKSIYALSGNCLLVRIATAENRGRRPSSKSFDLGIWNRKTGSLTNTNVDVNYIYEDRDGMVICKISWLYFNYWIVFDSNGQRIFESPWVNDLDFGGDRLIICHNTSSSLSYLNEKGTVEIQGPFTDAREFIRGFAKVSTGKRQEK